MSIFGEFTHSIYHEKLDQTFLNSGCLFDSI